MRPSTTNQDDRHRTGRAVTAAALLTTAGLLLAGCGAEDGDDTDVLTPATNEPGAVSTATLEADEVMSEDPDDTATTGAGRAGTPVALVDVA